MSKDRFESFAELRAERQEGEHFRIRVCRRKSEVAVLAPHGGTIEAHTSDIASAIAGDFYSLYCFEGIRAGRQGGLHITSSNFDEPRCLALIADHRYVLAIHGRKDRVHGFAKLDGKTIFVGGLDEDLRETLVGMLHKEGFRAKVDREHFPARHPMNICNRGKAGKGAQLELPRTLRNEIGRSAAAMQRLEVAVRASIAALQAAKM